MELDKNQVDKVAGGKEMKPEYFVYEVERGDTLSGLASRFLNSPNDYPEITKLNRIKDPNNIYEGEKLIIPNYEYCENCSCYCSVNHSCEGFCGCNNC